MHIRFVLDFFLEKLDLRLAMSGIQLAIPGRYGIYLAGNRMLKGPDYRCQPYMQYVFPCAVILF